MNCYTSNVRCVGTTSDVKPVSLKRLGDLSHDFNCLGREKLVRVSLYFTHVDRHER